MHPRPDPRSTEDIVVDLLEHWYELDYEHPDPMDARVLSHVETRRFFWNAINSDAE